MKRHLSIFLLTMVCAAMLAAPAHALEYTIDEPEDYLFGRPTSDDTIYEVENPNVDRSKNVSLVPPGFGTPTSYLPGSGEYLTPNLVPGALSGGLVNAVGSAGANATGGVAGSSTIADRSVMAGSSNVSVGSDGFPTVQTSSISAAEADALVSGTEYTGDYTEGGGFTEVTSDLYDSSNSLGRLEIPSIGVNVKVFQGTGSSSMAKGVGHFTETSIWDGNIGLAGHNRGVNTYFGKIHTLNVGDTMTFTTKLGTRTYAVTSVQKISATDSSGTAATSCNQLTLYTCVRNQSAYRWCVVAQEV